MPKDEGRRSFKYTRRTVEDVRERANMRGGDFDSIIKPKYKVFKVKDGKNVVRILPPTWDDARHYGYDLWVNYGIGVDNQSYLSLAKMKNEKDPLAEARKAAERDGDKDLSKALQPRQRIGMWVIDRNAEDEGPQVWLAPFTVDKDIINLSYDEDTKEVLFIDDPEKGMDLRFYKEGQGLKTKYDPTKMKIMKPSPIHEDEKVQEDWLNYINDNPLPGCLQFYDYEHIASVFDGQARVERSDDDEDEGKGTRRRASRNDDDDADQRPSRRRAAAPADDDEGEERPLKTNRRGNDDEDETPSPRRRAQLSESEDDEAEEPTSRRNGRGKPEPEDDEPEPEKEAPRVSLRDRLRQRRTEAED